MWCLLFVYIKYHIFYEKILNLFYIVFISPRFKWPCITLQNIKKIEMEIFKDGKNIGYCNYEFTKNDDSIKIYNETNFEVKLLGIKVFSINSIGTEIYKNNKLFSFNSNTLQNDKNKFVNLILNENEDFFDI